MLSIFKQNSAKNPSPTFVFEKKNRFKQCYGEANRAVNNIPFSINCDRILGVYIYY